MPIDSKQIEEWKELAEGQRRHSLTRHDEPEPMYEEVLALLAEREELLALLREIEWKGNVYSREEEIPACPSCGGEELHALGPYCETPGKMVGGHTCDCRLAAVLKGV